MTDRLQKCIKAGSIEKLFPLLVTWPQEELRALVADAETEYKQNEEKIDRLYKEYVFRPENFQDRNRAKMLDETTKEFRMKNMTMFSEICSVAYYYLRDNA